MTKVGPKEQRLRDMKAAGTLPKHAEMMLDDGAGFLVRLPEDEPKRKRPPATKKSTGVTLAAPIAVQKALAKEFAENDSAAKETARATVRAVDEPKKTKSPEPKDTPEAQQQENDMSKPTKKQTKKAATAKARTKVKPEATTSARPDGLRDGSKQAMMIDLALRPEGATEHEMCKKLGWKKCRVTLRRVAEKIGAKVETKKNAKEETVFFATRKKAS